MVTRSPSKPDRSEAAIRKLLDAAPDALAKLRVPFAENQIGLLPRARSKTDTQKSGCKPGTNASADGKFCGGYHVPSIHLDFVGHAALTDRLLEADDSWEWRPLAQDEFGMPKYDQFGGLWIELTVAGVTRLGYGDAQGKDPSSTAVKEIIGDALRNAGMRFGMALDLWHKGDLHDFAEEQGKVEAGIPDVTDPEPEDAKFDATREDVSEINWLTIAKAAPNKTKALEVYRNARREFGRTPTDEQRAILDAIVSDGRERFPEPPKEKAEAQAANTLRQGFEGPATPPHNPEDLV